MAQKDLYDQVTEALHTWKKGLADNNIALPDESDIRSDVQSATDAFIGGPEDEEEDNDDETEEESESESEGQAA